MFAFVYGFFFLFLRTLLRPVPVSIQFHRRVCPIVSSYSRVSVVLCELGILLAVFSVVGCDPMRSLDRRPFFLHDEARSVLVALLVFAVLLRLLTSGEIVDICLRLWR